MKNVFSTFFQVLVVLCLIFLYVQYKQINILKEQVAQLERQVVGDTIACGDESMQKEDFDMEEVALPQIASPAKMGAKDEKRKSSSQTKSAEKTVETESVKPTVQDNEEKAMESIRYCLKMYVPDLKYSAMRAVTKNNGTVDVIIDYKYVNGDIEHTYYNVSILKNGSYKINSIRGLEGNFPYYN